MNYQPLLEFELVVTPFLYILLTIWRYVESKGTLLYEYGRGYFQNQSIG